VLATVKHAIDNFRVVVYRDPAANCTDEPPDVRIDKTDDGAGWGASGSAAFKVLVSNPGRTAAGDLLVVEEVPSPTSFNAGASTPGWSCTDGAPAGSTCSFAIPTLAGFGASQALTFTVDVDPSTDAATDIYNRVVVYGDVDSASQVYPLTVEPRVGRSGRGVRQLPEGGKAWAEEEHCTRFRYSECRPDTDYDDCCAAAVIWAVKCYGAFGASSSNTDSTRSQIGLGATRGEVIVPALPGDGSLLYRIRDDVFANTDGGRRASELYYRHTPDLSLTLLTHPSLIVAAQANLADWEPGLRSLADGDGGNAVITQQQIDGLNAFLDELVPVATAELLEAIERERGGIDLSAWVGKTMDEALADLDLLGCEGSVAGDLCGDGGGDCRISATDALLTLQTAVGSHSCESCLCDVNSSGDITATDALSVLQSAVGQTVTLQCVPCS